MFDFIKRWTKTEHELCQENLSAFLDGQLNQRECQRVEKHLEKCSACQEDFESLQKTVTLLRKLPVVQPPRTFFIPASERARQRQVQRARLAYGYLQAATVAVTILLVLFVSGDALLHYGAVRHTPPLLVAQPATRTFQAEPIPPLSASPEALIAAIPTPLLEDGRVPQQLAVPTMPAAPAEQLGVGEVSPTEAVQTVTGGQEMALKAIPSQTFARSAGPPSPPTPSVKAETTPPSLAREELVTATPTSTPLPTATPLPINTAIQPTPASPLPSPQPVKVQEQGPQAPPTLSGPWALIEVAYPFLPWIEWTLAIVVAMLLIITLWLRSKQHLV